MRYVVLGQNQTTPPRWTMTMPAQRDLIFDLGCHIGEDAGFYLQKGFRVVGVEANPNLCARLRECFARPLASGQFTLVEKAIAETSGSIEFYANAVERLGSANRQVAVRSVSRFYVIRVPATTFDILIGEFGVPHYVKIDIQGSDLLCLRQLGRVQERPNFMSIGVQRTALAEGIKLFKELGYRKFQIIDQSRVPAQQCPHPRRRDDRSPTVLVLAHRGCSATSCLMIGALEWARRPLTIKRSSVYVSLERRTHAHTLASVLGIALICDAHIRSDFAILLQRAEELAAL